MDIIDLLERRYACKRFDGRHIGEQELAKLKEAVRLSPSSYNSQPWKVFIVSDEGKKARMRDAARGQEQITTCSHLFVFCAPKDAEAQFRRLGALMHRSGVEEGKVRAHVENATASKMALEPAQRLAWAQRQAYLPLMSLMLEAAALGLDSCPMEGFESTRFAEILGTGDWVPTVLCPVGYAADSPREKIRFTGEEVFTEV